MYACVCHQILPFSLWCCSFKQDCGTESPTPSNMEEMLDYFEERGNKLDSLDISSIPNCMENNFVSKITFGGVPILPPMVRI